MINKNITTMVETNARIHDATESDVSILLRRMTKKDESVFAGTTEVRSKLSARN